MKRALLFDIDGTLILSGGAGARALNRAFKHLYGIDGAMENVHPHGKTDPEIVREIFKKKLYREPLKAEISVALSFYVYFLRYEVQSALKFRVLPGVKELLEELKGDSNFLNGLATGNIRSGARVKLGRPGLWKYFLFGGFGSDAENRTEILRKAVKRAKDFSNNSVHPIVIGDTPRDIYAAHTAGIPVLAVATSMYTVEDLEKAGADFTVSNLSDREKILYILRNY